MIMSRRMRWAGPVGGMGKRGMHIGKWLETRRKGTTFETKTLMGGQY
jgi:hypothetical protein